MKSFDSGQVYITRIGDLRKKKSSSFDSRNIKHNSFSLKKGGYENSLISIKSRIHGRTVSNNIPAYIDTRSKKRKMGSKFHKNQKSMTMEMLTPKTCERMINRFNNTHTNARKIVNLTPSKTRSRLINQVKLNTSRRRGNSLLPISSPLEHNKPRRNFKFRPLEVLKKKNSTINNSNERKKVIKEEMIENEKKKTTKKKETKKKGIKNRKKKDGKSKKSKRKGKKTEYDSEPSSLEKIDLNSFFIKNPNQKKKKKKKSGLRSNQRKIDSYKLGNLLGSGANGKVWIGMEKEKGFFFALKEIHFDNQSIKKIQEIQKEINIMKRLSHKNICSYYGSRKYENSLHIFLEFVPGGSLQKVISEYGKPGLSEEITSNYTKQILRGLKYLHKFHVIHRDIKAANILVGIDSTVRLSDFGCSRDISELKRLQTLIGTPNYMAPEVIKQIGYGKEVDIWSVGCTVLEMLSGQPPYIEYMNPAAVLFRIVNSNEPPKYPDNLSKEATDFLNLCFLRDFKKRPSATQLLRHPFIKKHKKYVINMTDLGVPNEPNTSKKISNSLMNTLKESKEISSSLITSLKASWNSSEKDSMESYSLSREDSFDEDFDEFDKVSTSGESETEYEEEDEEEGLKIKEKLHEINELKKRRSFITMKRMNPPVNKNHFVVTKGTKIHSNSESNSMIEKKKRKTKRKKSIKKSESEPLPLIKKKPRRKTSKYY